MAESYKCNRKYILSDLDSTFIALSDEESASICGANIGNNAQFSDAGNSVQLSQTAQEVAAQTQKMLDEQRAFQFLMAKIKNDHAMRQDFITALRQQATDNKNSFN